MGILFSFLLVTLAGLFAIPVIVFCIEILAAMITAAARIFISRAPTDRRTCAGS